jgi:hypothetical protein
VRRMSCGGVRPSLAWERSALPDHVGGYPMSCWRLSSAIPDTSALRRPASQQNSNHSVVTFAAQTGLVKYRKEALALCRSQVNQLPIRIPGFFTPFTRRIPAARSGVAVRNRQPRRQVYGRPAEVDRRRCIIGLFEDAVSSDDSLVESEERFRAVPVDEFADRGIIRSFGNPREVRLFTTADFDCSRSASFKTVFGLRLRLFLAIPAVCAESWPYNRSPNDQPQKAEDAKQRRQAAGTL